MHALMIPPSTVPMQQQQLQLQPRPRPRLQLQPPSQPSPWAWRSRTPRICASSTYCAGCTWCRPSRVRDRAASAAWWSPKRPIQQHGCCLPVRVRVLHWSPPISASFCWWWWWPMPMPTQRHLVHYDCCCCCFQCWSYQCADSMMTTRAKVDRGRHRHRHPRRPGASWRTRHPWTSSGGPGGVRRCRSFVLGLVD